MVGPDPAPAAGKGLPEGPLPPRTPLPWWVEPVRGRTQQQAGDCSQPDRSPPTGKTGNANRRARLDLRARRASLIWTLNQEEKPARPPESAPPIHRFADHPKDTLPASYDEQLRMAYNNLHALHRFRTTPGYYRWLLAMLPARTGLSLLDVGCGSGSLLRDAADMGLRVSGVDISDVGLAQARNRVPDADLRVARAEELPFADSSFDLVSCAGSLEHVSDIGQAVREMARVTRPGGRALVGVPNSRFAFVFVAHLRQRLFPDQSQPVERLATRGEWEEILTRNGLRVVRTAKDNNAFLPTPVLQAAMRGIGGLMPTASCYQFIFVAEPTKV